MDEISLHLLLFLKLGFPRIWLAREILPHLAIRSAERHLCLLPCHWNSEAVACRSSTPNGFYNHSAFSLEELSWILKWQGAHRSRSLTFCFFPFSAAVSSAKFRLKFSVRGVQFQHPLFSKNILENNLHVEIKRKWRQVGHSSLEPLRSGTNISHRHSRGLNMTLRLSENRLIPFSYISRQ